jgi:signal transduction histidine kinase
MLSRPEGLRVLVVDDDANMLRTIGDILGFKGYNVVGVSTARAGLRVASGDEPPPSVALVDLKLPDMDGIELAGRLREAATTTEVVILTGNASIESAVRAMREQSYDYLIKPVRPEQLLETVDRAGDRAQRRRAESALDEALRQKQKLEVVARLSSSVAHDFNNLLTAVRGFASLLLQTHGPDDPGHPMIEGIRDAADRGSALTRRLLALTRAQVAHPRLMDLRDVVLGLERLLRQLAGEGITIDMSRVAPSMINADPVHIEQILVNLVVNARDAMPEGGTITVASTGIPAVDFETGVAHPRRPHVLLTVSDTGTGIPMEIVPRIFEPFFTTKADGTGTGLGLATVYEIVKEYGGAVHVASPARGPTTFSIYLPAA